MKSDEQMADHWVGSMERQMAVQKAEQWVETLERQKER
jgi:hypothetical protein